MIAIESAKLQILDEADDRRNVPYPNIGMVMAKETTILTMYLNSQWMVAKNKRDLIMPSRACL